MPRRRRPAQHSPGTPAPLRPLDSHRPATLIRRLAALIYDWVLLTGVLFGATVVVLAFRAGEAFQPHDAGYSAYLIGTGAVFFSWFWIHGGQTLGMRAWKIKLITVDGQPITWRQALWRCGWALAGAACFGLGYLWLLVDPECRCWQDIASGTQIIACPPPVKQNGA